MGDGIEIEPGDSEGKPSALDDSDENPPQQGKGGFFDDEDGGADVAASLDESMYVRFEGDTETLFSSLIEAQQNFDTPRLTETADQRAYSYDYSPLEEILKAVRDALHEAGFAIMQPVAHDGAGGERLHTVLAHESGGRIHAATAMPDESDMHDRGSAITYLRRYSLTSLLGIRAEEDDDAQRAVSE